MSSERFAVLVHCSDHANVTRRPDAKEQPPGLSKAKGRDEVHYR